jgi:hypothetical protein
MQQHQVTFIGEFDLPPGHSWALVRDPLHDRYELFINPDAITPALLTDCWEAFLAMDREGPAAPPPIRVPHPCAPLAYSSSSTTPTRSM